MTSDQTEQFGSGSATEVGAESTHGVSRRTLLVAGWSAPVIMAVAPSVAFAASGAVSGNTRTKGGGGGTPISQNQGTSGGGGTGNTGGSNGSPGTGGINEQQHEGAQPARSNRGFTG